LFVKLNLYVGYTANKLGSVWKLW